MADERKFWYRGPIPTTKKADPQRCAPLSSDNALAIIKRGWTSGRIQLTQHFKEQCVARKFDLVDAENAVRVGKLRGEPEFCPEFDNWKYRIIGKVEDRRLEVVIALDPTEDYESPLLVPITGYWK